MATARTPPLPGALPAPRTPLFGRDGERAAGSRCLLTAATPLLTLTGAGGSGKTRLALTLAADSRHAFPDGVVFVDLATVDDPALIPALVATALEARPAPGEAIAAALMRYLHGKKLLLLLDNCEHVLVDTANLVAALLAHCPRLQVLATSRAPLRLRAEQILPVDPLPAPAPGATLAALRANAAVAMFVDRAQAVAPGFTLDVETAEIAGALCRELDGLPLAIELAAARLRVFPLPMVLEQVHGRLPWPEAAPRDLPARQHTMRSAIAWSYDLLDDRLQQLFCLLSVFAGGFTLEAAERVGDALPGTPVAAGVASLVEQGLVTRVWSGPEFRFRLLEPIRAFGQEQLAATGSQKDAGAAHASYVLAYAEALHPNRVAPGEHVQQRVQRLERELPNLRTALAWLAGNDEPGLLLRLAASLAVYWHLRAHFDEGQHWLEQALAATPPEPTAPRGHALGGLALILWAQNHYAPATAAAQASLAIAERLGDQEMAANALHVLGMTAEIQDQWTEATAYLESACARWRALEARAEEAWGLTLLCRAATGLGQPDLALRHAEQALEMFREIGHPAGAATALSRLAELTRARGNDESAATAYQEALALYEVARDPWLITLPLAGLADLAAAHEQAPAAIALIAFLDTFAAATGASLLTAAWRCRDRAERGAAAHLGVAQVRALLAAAEATTLEEAVAIAANVTVAPRYAHREAGPDSLTAREREILRLLAGMLTEEEIAATLSLSRRTVSGHVTHVLAKLDVSTRRAAVARGRALGLLPDHGA
ncbi:MAG: LuxR C-terminal-related transcriptional regulator [Thermomicrobiales bacterium]